MPVTQKDIARELGVSVMAVHRALSGSGYVSCRLKERILAHAARVNYRPHRGAQALVRNRLRRLALFSVESPSFFWDDVAVGIRAALDQAAPFGYAGTYRRIPAGDTDRYLRVVRAALREGADAVALVNNYEFDMGRVFRLLEESRIPYLMFNIDAPGSGRSCFIGPDYCLQGRLAADFVGKVLSGSGKVGILFSDVPAALKSGTQGISSQRRHGFTDYLEEHYPRIRAEVQAIDHALPERTIRRRILDYLGRARGLDALYCVPPYSLLAGHCLQESGRAGRTSLVTFDLYPELKALIEAGVVTGTICQKPVQQGYYAVRILEQILESKAPPASEEFHISPHVVVRANVDVEEDLFTINRMLAGSFPGPCATAAS